MLWWGHPQPPPQTQTQTLSSFSSQVAICEREMETEPSERQSHSCVTRERDQTSFKETSLSHKLSWLLLWLPATCLLVRAVFNRRTQAASLPSEGDVAGERGVEGDSEKGAEGSFLHRIGVGPLKIRANSRCYGNGLKSSNSSRESVAPPSATRGLPGLQFLCSQMRRGETRRGTYALAFCNSAVNCSRCRGHRRVGWRAGGQAGGGRQCPRVASGCTSPTEAVLQCSRSCGGRAAEGRSCPVSASQSEE